MKRRLLVVLFLSLALGCTTTTTWAAPVGSPTAQDGGDSTTAPPSQADAPQTSDPSQSSLEQVIGALGLFAAMMAVLALGTEVVIDTLKFFVGLKHKPTALEALDKFGTQLPGQLNELGVSSQAITRLEGVIAGMKDVLEPLNYPVKLTQAVRDGDLGATVRAAEEWAKAAGLNPNASKQPLVGAVTQGLQDLGSNLNIAPQAIQNITNSVSSALDNLSIQDAVTKILEIVQGQALLISHAWLESHLIALTEMGVEKGRAEIMRRFDGVLVPKLKEIGLGEAAVQTVRDQIETGLAKATGQLHLKAMENLLQGVENKRFEIQSPLRKTWRRLRNSQFSPLVGWIDAVRRRLNKPALNAKWVSRLNHVRLGKPFELAERFWNHLLGRTPKQGVGLDQPLQVAPLTAATLAQRLLEADSKHQDEEASRLRVLRVISIFVGVYLAFRLQVNAIDILAETFSGLQNINETVNTARVLGWLNPPWLVDLINRNWLTVPAGLELNAGILLSGLAASAGSAFWHDQLEKLQVAKKAVGQVEKTIQAIQEAPK